MPTRIRPILQIGPTTYYGGVAERQIDRYAKEYGCSNIGNTKLPRWQRLQQKFEQLKVLGVSGMDLTFIRERRGTRPKRSVYVQKLREQGIEKPIRSAPKTPPRAQVSDPVRTALDNYIRIPRPVPYQIPGDEPPPSVTEISGLRWDTFLSRTTRPANTTRPTRTRS